MLAVRRVDVSIGLVGLTKDERQHPLPDAVGMTYSLFPPEFRSVGNFGFGH